MWMEVWLYGCAIGVFLAFAVDSLVPRKGCPDCGHPLPRLGLALPTNLRQWLWGGCSCPKCGCDTDWRGRRVD
jgi:hypothetical protein